MTKPLIIVESYTKTKTISKYLDNKYNVICSFGHFDNLPKSELGINTQTWKGTYVSTNTKICSNIRKFVKDANAVYIASDPDMEGEAIAYHIYCIIKTLLKNKPYYRVKFNEITKNAVVRALTNPVQIDMDIVHAQETRRFIDRLVGYKLSPLLWRYFSNYTLSVGRVQTIALYLAYKAFEENQQHDIVPYWTMKGIFHSTKSLDITIEFKLHYNNTIHRIAQDDIINMLDMFNFKDEFHIASSQKQYSESPSPPYTTTSLQQDAYNKHSFGSKKTMQLAQQLYENGFITYMRTDSVNISQEFKNKISKYIIDNYGETYSHQRTFQNKISNSQEAHEAIRITNCDTTCELSIDHVKLYRLIKKRTIASQMKNAEYIRVEAVISYSHMKYTWHHSHSILIEPGYLILDDTRCKEETKEYIQLLNCLQPHKYICEANVNSPVSLYNEITLIKKLEKKGIGRPSTYSSIVEKIMSKKYVVKGALKKREIVLNDHTKSKKGVIQTQRKLYIGGTNKDMLIPTELGIKVIEYVSENIDYLLDVKFTADMENILDEICNKTKTKESVLDTFYEENILPYA